MEANGSDLLVDGEARQVLRTALGRVAPAITLGAVVCVGITALFFNSTEGRSSSSDPEAALYRHHLGQAVSDVRCGPSHGGSGSTCRYKVEGWVCIASFAEGAGFRVDRCRRP